MYQPTFAIDAIGRPEPAAQAIGLGIADDLLWALMKANERYLRAYSDQFKPLYGSKIEYGIVRQDPKKKCGDDLWRDIATVYPTGVADAKELAAIRAAELRVRFGVAAIPRVRESDHRIIVEYPRPAAMPTRFGKPIPYPSNVHVEGGVIFEDPAEVLGAPVDCSIAKFLEKTTPGYRPTIVIDAIGRDERSAIDLGVDIMGDLLWCLVKIDSRYLVAFPDQFADLYSEEAGLVYGDQRPAQGSACGDDDWRDIAVLYRLRVGDCEELAAARVAIVRIRRRIRATPMVVLQKGTTVKRRSRHLYHVMVRWPSGLPVAAYPKRLLRLAGMLVECPSEKLGMKTTLEAA